MLLDELNFVATADVVKPCVLGLLPSFSPERLTHLSCTAQSPLASGEF